jgi:hypothetical protein
MSAETIYATQRGALNALPSTPSDEHAWFLRDQQAVCAKCTVVRRADGNNKPCRGVVRITTRGATK